MDVRADPFAPVIAIIDGDPALRNALAFCLELEGYAMVSYPSAEAAIAQPAAATCPVLDEKLPGVGGLWLVRMLRDLGPTLPAILIVTKPTRRLLSDASAAGVSVVEKPPPTEDPEKTVRHALQLRADARSRPSRAERRQRPSEAARAGHWTTDERGEHARR